MPTVEPGKIQNSSELWRKHHRLFPSLGSVLLFPLLTAEDSQREATLRPQHPGAQQQRGPPVRQGQHRGDCQASVSQTSPQSWQKRRGTFGVCARPVPAEDAALSALGALSNPQAAALGNPTPGLCLDRCAHLPEQEGKRRPVFTACSWGVAGSEEEAAPRQGPLSPCLARAWRC